MSWRYLLSTSLILLLGCGGAPCPEPVAGSGPSLADSGVADGEPAGGETDAADGSSPGAEDTATPETTSPAGCDCFESLEPYGLETVSAKGDVAATVKRVVEAAEKRGFKILATVDHGAAATKAGLELDPTVLVIFGKPEAGTPLMKQEPTLAIDLPIHMLVWTQAGKAAISYDRPSYLAQRYQLDAALFDKMSTVVDEIAAEASGHAAAD